MCEGEARSALLEHHQHGDNGGDERNADEDRRLDEQEADRLGGVGALAQGTASRPAGLSAGGGLDQALPKNARI